MGFMKNSKVPLFFSSLKLRIVTAGMRKYETQGISERESAKPELGILNSPSNTHKKALLLQERIVASTGREEKNEEISFFRIAGWLVFIKIKEAK
jgi:hypothetical protein